MVKSIFAIYDVTTFGSLLHGQEPQLQNVV